MDTIAVTAVNDAFVMAYWAENLGATGKLVMLADGNATFAKMLGVDRDMSSNQMGTRSKRYALIIRNGLVKYVGVDESGALEKSSAQAVLENL